MAEEDEPAGSAPANRLKRVREGTPSEETADEKRRRPNTPEDAGDVVDAVGYDGDNDDLISWSSSDRSESPALSDDEDLDEASERPADVASPDDTPRASKRVRSGPFIDESSDARSETANLSDDADGEISWSETDRAVSEAPSNDEDIGTWRNKRSVDDAFSDDDTPPASKRGRAERSDLFVNSDDSSDDGDDSGATVSHIRRARDFTPLPPDTSDDGGRVGNHYRSLRRKAPKKIVERVKRKEKLVYYDMDDSVLVADEPGAEPPHRVRFRKLSSLQSDPERRLNAEELDGKSIIIRSNGDYLPRSEVYWEEADRVTRGDLRQIKNDPKKARDVLRAYADRMDVHSLSNARLHEDVGHWPKKEERSFQTPGGTRWRDKLLRHPLQAGENNPDILVRENGEFYGIWPRQEGLADIADIEEKYGAGNYWIKSRHNRYLTPESFVRSESVRMEWGGDREGSEGERALREAVATFTGRVFIDHRTDLTQAIVLLPSGKLDDLVKLDKWSRFGVPKALKDRSKLDVVLQAPEGTGFLQPGSYDFAYNKVPEHCSAVMNGLNLPEELKSARSKAWGIGFARTPDNELKWINEISSDSYPEVMGEWPPCDLFLQKWKNDGKAEPSYTGNFKSLEALIRFKIPVSQEQKTALTNLISYEDMSKVQPEYYTTAVEREETALPQNKPQALPRTKAKSLADLIAAARLREETGMPASGAQTAQPIQRPTDAARQANSTPRAKAASLSELMSRARLDLSNRQNTLDQSRN